MTLIAPGHLRGSTRVDVAEPGQVIEIVGRIDSRSAHEIRCAIDAAIGHGVGDLLVDMRLAEVYDSAGLGVLVGCHHRAAMAERRLVVAHPSERFERLVRGTRLGRVLHRVA